ncbi:MAG: ATP-binding protein [Rhodobacteraceae bacterium]|nr:MAG: ATP-binding protein [Paracoccaceae bacterium]
MRTYFSPFPTKALGKIEATDLNLLKDVNEGWYIEYKRILVSPKDIAKAISAFSNTYGGFLFFGVEEKSKTESVAGRCLGIPEKDIAGALQCIRQSANHHLNPCPHFDLTVVFGPNEEMELGAGMGVICIEIPMSPNAPILHSDGRIYRRVAESAEPVIETDRYQLGLLWDRRKEMNEKYKRWIVRKPEQTIDQPGTPYARILFDADPYHASGKTWGLSLDQVRDTLNTNDGPRIPMETIYHSNLGIIARQTSSLTRHEDFGLTILIGSGLRFEVWIPINLLEVTDPKDLKKPFSRCKNIDNFIEILVRSRSKKTRVIDLNQIFGIVTTLSHVYTRLLRSANLEIPVVGAKVICSSVMYSVPFIDSPPILKRFEKYGLPLALTDATMVPYGYDADSFQEINVPPSPMDSLMIGVFTFELFCRGLGITGLIPEEGEITDYVAFKEFYDSLLEAGQFKGS